METHPQILEGTGVRKGDGKQKVQHRASFFVILVIFNISLKYYSLGPCCGGSRAGWCSPGHQAPPQRWQWPQAGLGWNGTPGPWAWWRKSQGQLVRGTEAHSSLRCCQYGYFTIKHLTCVALLHYYTTTLGREFQPLEGNIFMLLTVSSSVGEERGCISHDPGHVPSRVTMRKRRAPCCVIRRAQTFHKEKGRKAH